VESRLGQMKIPTFIKRALPTINRPQHCPECGTEFACEIGLSGCWCGQMKLSATTLTALRSKYKSCLCRTCLEKAEIEYGDESIKQAKK
jgi:hypothetical protein